ncbi:hypothetical protein HXX76_014122 [Chlamydomonas incerta]|uniref:Uncharacterized protein n=1 Tax=Chlamydomonas incerta TaxID=51695 RepID=A0A835VTI3_CHLIN|nr:hypothetical protein HXX76_014122 [Chlamydomonas incerta]|eukprot:KAG2424964.1 hypothetical protein HXX76_014122 [Chlamydomonas incerta]
MNSFKVILPTLAASTAAGGKVTDKALMMAISAMPAAYTWNTNKLDSMRLLIQAVVVLAGCLQTALDGANPSLCEASMSMTALLMMAIYKSSMGLPPRLAAAILQMKVLPLLGKVMASASGSVKFLGEFYFTCIMFCLQMASIPAIQKEINNLKLLDHSVHGLIVKNPTCILEGMVGMLINYTTTPAQLLSTSQLLKQNKRFTTLLFATIIHMISELVPGIQNCPIISQTKHSLDLPSPKQCKEAIKGFAKLMLVMASTSDTDTAFFFGTDMTWRQANKLAEKLEEYCLVQSKSADDGNVWEDDEMVHAIVDCQALTTQPRKKAPSKK